MESSCFDKTKYLLLGMGEKTKEITAKQYAKIQGCTEQNITKHIRNENWKFLPFVIRIKRFSRFVVLEVPCKLGNNDYKDKTKP